MGVDHFDSSQDTLSIADIQFLRSCRVTFGEFSMNGFNAICIKAVAPILPDIVRHRRDIGEPASQRPEIEPRPADDDRDFSPALNVLDHALGIGEPSAGRIGLIGRNMAVQMMRNALHLHLRGARRQKPQAVINLHRIRIHNLAIETAGEIERQAGLAAGGRPGYQDGLFAL